MVPWSWHCPFLLLRFHLEFFSDPLPPPPISPALNFLPKNIFLSDEIMVLEGVKRENHFKPFSSGNEDLFLLLPRMADVSIAVGNDAPLYALSHGSMS